MDKKIIEQFEKLDFNELFGVLSAYVEYKINVHRVYGINGYEFIMDAITKLLCGKNKWDIKKYPDLTPILRKNIWRDICHEVEKRAKNQEYNNFMNPEDIDTINIGKLPLVELRRLPVDQESTQLRWKAIKDTCKSDEDASFILEVMEIEQIYSPTKIANYCEWPVERVHNAFKRIRRKANLIKNKEVMSHE